MAKMSGKQTKVHNAFLGMKRPFDATEVYVTMCKLQGLAEDSIERGLGKLFKEGKLKPPQDRPRKKKKAAPARADF